MASTPLTSNHEHHIVPTQTYFLTLVALTVLMVITVAVAKVNLPEIGPFSGTVVNQTIALVIACIKAFLVVWIFMGIKWSTNLTKLWAMLGFIWFTLFSIIFADYTTRQYEPVNSWEKEGSGLPRTIKGRMPQPMLDPNDANMRPRG